MAKAKAASDGESQSVHTVLGSPENMLGEKFDNTRRYLLATPRDLPRLRLAGYQLELENVQGSAGETFTLVSKKKETTT